jgi:hypothetical protein
MKNTESGEPNQQETTAKFAQLVLQQTNMALIFLGKAANPETGKVTQDLEHARHFIDQLEMLEIKTRGNLNSYEEKLLKQSLATLRLSFVEVVSAPAPQGAEAAAAQAGPAAQGPVAEAPPKAAAPQPEQPAESRKKFTKKYEG